MNTTTGRCGECARWKRQPFTHCMAVPPQPNDAAIPPASIDASGFPAFLRTTADLGCVLFKRGEG